MTTATLRQTAPLLETLEDRLTPAVSFYQGGLYIYGNDGYNDVATVEIERYGSTYYYKVTDNGSPSWHVAASVYTVSFYGYGGNDFFANNSFLTSFVYGHGGNDTLIGGNGRDYLDGGFGSDDLFGGADNDHLIGGLDYESNDLYGMDGDDELTGGYSGDWLFGGNGTDTLYGIDGPDYLFGEAGTDYLYGGWGMDWLDGGRDGSFDRLRGEGDVDFYYRDWQYLPGYGWYDADSFYSDYYSGLNGYAN